METEGSIGTEAKYKLEVADGKLKLSLDYDGKQTDAHVSVSLDVKEFVDLLKKAIPGKVDDAVLDLLLKALV